MRETIGTFELVREMLGKLGREAFGSLILSMTRNAADILGVYVLAKQAGLYADPACVERCSLPIMPLFETIGDLRRAPGILRELLATPLVRRSVRAFGGMQEVMIGYSDSNKDGGFLSCNWELANAQMQLTAVGQDAGVDIAFFHGRGGSVSRGGLPASRAISAQPPGSIRGLFRLTEQGEVVSTKYANRGTAAYNVELLAASVFDHAIRSAGQGVSVATPEFDDALEALAGAAHATYVNLISHPGHRQLFPGRQSARGNLAAQHRLASGPPLRRQVAGGTARDSVGVRLGAEPPHRDRLVRCRQRAGRLLRGAGREGRGPAQADVRAVEAVPPDRRRSGKDARGGRPRHRRRLLAPGCRRRTCAAKCLP